MMKNVIQVFLILFACVLGGSAAYAQNDEAVEISDEELRRYAIAMDSVESMKQSIIEMMNTEVTNNEDMTGARFNELSKIIEDSVKLAEANATEEEINFISSIKDRKDEMTADINNTFRTLAIDYIGDGGRVYKKIKGALQTDPEVKERYEEILAELNEDEDDAGEDAEDNSEETSDTAKGNN